MQDHSSFYQLIGTLGLYILIGQTLRMLKMTLLPYDPVSTANQLGWNDAKCVLELKGDEVKSPHYNRHWLYKWWEIWNDWFYEEIKMLRKK